ETRHWSDRIVQHESRMIANFLKLRRCLTVTAHLGIRQTAHVDRIESSEEGGASEVCGTRHSELERSGGLRHFERFRRVAVVERVERSQASQAYRAVRQ